MEVNSDELRGSYASWGIDYRKVELGFGQFGEFGDDFVGLPDDPFCMNIRSTLNTISDWFHENQMLQHQITLPEDPFCMKVRSTFNTISDWFHENHKDLVTEQFSLSWFDLDGVDDVVDDDDAVEAHDAFELVLSYLELKEILAVEGVCRSLRDSVRKEPFFWRTIDLNDSFLQYRVTDESLLKLTRRAQGDVRCLNLGGCVGITDYGLKQVLAINPHLTKLSVSGCLRLSTAGLLSTLRDLKSSNRLGVKSLITGGALYFTKVQFKELNLLLGGDAKARPKSRKKRFYTSCRSEFSLEDDRVTDLEICPWCEKPSLVFDCPAETCPLKGQYPYPKSSCRACVVCIERCHECGSCLNDCENKPFCFAFSCVVCIEKRSNQL
ncbi:F-box-like domain superfamily [Arabidopsis thaliana x Arabidopsis arenosa]|uniref:F-box-like domain superfamily n=1 Tax=Arabidopsis thaliana x Arabidopsis arenosa TaxID=1240361 RepID=A0A8T1ZL46_9BRAS|nr:F-box-like domain superfamily [Arabidopsis thaliana x Arabidopsis arenosa]